MAVENQDFTIYQGTSLEITGTVLDGEGAAQDITGYNVLWTLWDEAGIYIHLEVGDGVTLTDPTNGVFTVTVPLEETKELYGDYEHEARAVDVQDQEDVVFVGTGTVRRSRSRA